MARVLISGGLGCVGSNYARHRLAKGDDVIVLDNYTRGKSNDLNEMWLREQPGHCLFIGGDVADDATVALALEDGVDDVIHCAAQSSVNVSIANPELDFASNVIGSFELFNQIRLKCPKARVINFASNKVYDVTDWPTEIVGTHYRWLGGKRVGPAESRPFHTDAKEPYGASKISALYYARCFAAMYDMSIVTLVPSGMYGPRQFGKEEQGWLGWFIIACQLGLPITIFGDGFQVRDMVHTDDVCIALDLLLDKAQTYKGELFNLGGGPRNAISLIEALHVIAGNLGTMSRLVYTDWRPQDNKVYISNVERMVSIGWTPIIDIKDGIARMCSWVQANRRMLETLYLQEVVSAPR